MPNWISEHPVRRPDQSAPARNRETPAYVPGQMVRCLGCGHEHVKNVSPTSGPQALRTHCPECEQMSAHLAVGRALDTYRIALAEREATE